MRRKSSMKMPNPEIVDENHSEQLSQQENSEAQQQLQKNKNRFHDQLSKQDLKLELLNNVVQKNYYNERMDSIKKEQYEAFQKQLLIDARNDRIMKKSLKKIVKKDTTKNIDEHHLFDFPQEQTQNASQQKINFNLGNNRSNTNIVEQKEHSNKIQNSISIHFPQSIPANRWKPLVRDKATISFYNGQVFLYGGICANIIREIDNFDLENQQWTQISDVKTQLVDLKSSVNFKLPARTDHSAVIFGKNIIFFGGYESYNEKLKQRIMSRDIILFNTENHIRRTLAYKTESKYVLQFRRCHSAALVGKQMIVLGGMNNNEMFLNDFVVLELHSQIFKEYNHWIKQSTVPYKNGIINHQICAIFEDKSNSTLFGPKDQSQIKQGKKLFHSENPYKEEGLFLFGGELGNGKILEELWLLKPSQNDKMMEWKIVETIGQKPLSRTEHTMSFMHQILCLVIYGGKNNQLQHTRYLNDINVLNLKNLNWLQIDIRGIDKPPRCRHCACENKTQLIIFGGLNEGGYLNADLLIIEFDQRKIQMLTYDDQIGLSSRKINNVKKIDKLIINKSDKYLYNNDVSQKQKIQIE